jgi:uncharacterized protein YndB with AHSA1/START domain
MQTSTSATDRIEKTAVLEAPRSRVWRALTNAEEFGTWFRARFSGTFAVGAVLRAPITYPGYEHLTMAIRIVSMEPERYFAFRWHPHEVDLSKDYSAEPTTLVEFTLEDAPDGTKLTVVESGFDALPPGRRDEAFRSNDAGWTEQMQNIARHVAGT